MRVRALTPTGEWTFGGSESNYKVNRGAVAQCIQTRLASWLGNCFFDTGAGVDWLNFLGGSKNLLFLQLSVQSVIANTPYVTGVLQVSANLDSLTRKLTLAYSANTTFGTVYETITLVTPSLGTEALITEDGDEITTQSGVPIIV